MSGPNKGYVYYCRADVFADIAENFEKTDDVVFDLREKGCKRGKRGPRQGIHLVCKACRGTPNVADFYDSTYECKEVMMAWERANKEDEASQAPWVKNDSVVKPKRKRDGNDDDYDEWSVSELQQGIALMSRALAKRASR